MVGLLGARTYRCGMSHTEASLWLEIVERLGLPPSASVDAAHKALAGTVGRGTVQRIKEGKSNAGLATVERLAKFLRCDPADLLAGAYARERSTATSAPASGMGLVTDVAMTRTAGLIFFLP